MWADKNHNEVSKQEQNYNDENHDKSSQHNEDSTNHEQQVISDENEKMVSIQKWRRIDTKTRSHMKKLR